MQQKFNCKEQGCKPGKLHPRVFPKVSQKDACGIKYNVRLKRSTQEWLKQNLLDLITH